MEGSIERRNPTVTKFPFDVRSGTKDALTGPLSERKYRLLYDRQTEDFVAWLSRSGQLHIEGNDFRTEQTKTGWLSIREFVAVLLIRRAAVRSEANGLVRAFHPAQDQT